MSDFKAYADELAKLYNNFIDESFKLPANEGLRLEARRYFDTGFLWMREAIVLNIVTQKKPEEVAAVN